MSTEEYKIRPYTIELDWEKEVVWLNNHITQEKLIISERDAQSISDAFKLFKVKAEKNQLPK